MNTHRNELKNIYLTDGCDDGNCSPLYASVHLHLYPSQYLVMIDAYPLDRDLTVCFKMITRALMSSQANLVSFSFLACQSRFVLFPRTSFRPLDAASPFLPPPRFGAVSPEMIVLVEAPPLLVGAASSFPIANSTGSSSGSPTTTLDVGPGRRVRPSSSFCSVMICARYPMKSSRWRIGFALDTGGSPDTNAQESFDGDNGGPSRTRLGTVVRAAAAQLIEKLNSARKNFPMKIFLLLLGFYTANALATILGQTGDWDVLVAGVVVAAIEGIGMLMYRNRKPFSMPLGRFQSFLVLVNYWKAGVCLGLFVDAFKLGS